jgi:glycogen phosphorylase
VIRRRSAWPTSRSSAASRVNGVAELHTRLLKRAVLFHDFHELFPDKFNNKTNGVTPRRWLAHSNPTCAAADFQPHRRGWVTDLSRCRRLRRWPMTSVSVPNGARPSWPTSVGLRGLVATRGAGEPDPAMLFDVQVKRIHEYKRQLLNVLHVIHLYDRIKRGDTADVQPRCVLFGGKAAPGYAHRQADHQADQQRR